MSRVLGLDYGTKRVGIAISDPLRLIATPVVTVSRSKAAETVRRLAGIHEIEVLVIGLPTALGGTEGESARGARELGAELGEATGITVEFVDERYTTRMAEGAMISSGVRRRRRRESVDKVAAAILLQDYLDNRP